MRRRGGTVLFTLSVVATVALITLVAGVVAGRASTDGGGGGGGGEGGGGEATAARVDVIVKATDSSFWQTMVAGAERAGQEFGIDVSVFGPPAETDVEEQVQLMENSISRGVDAIVLASNSSDALNSVIDRARQQDIGVITVDNAVTTESEGFIGTDNIGAGQQAGQRLCRLLRRQGSARGDVMIASSVAGVQVLRDRDQGFRDGLREGCPDVRVAIQRYNNNDLNTAASQVNDVITSNRDLVGIFADNNTSGVGAARAIQDNRLADRLPVVAFDSDPQENEALRTGAIDALVVQNPFFFGYQGVLEAAMVSAGSDPPARLDPGAVVVDRENMDDPVVRRLLEPPTAEAQG
jgi:ribose transport system substrate-binding protein